MEHIPFFRVKAPLLCLLESIVIIEADSHFSDEGITK